MSPFLWLILKSCFMLLICAALFYRLGWWRRNKEAWGEVLEVRREYTEEKEGAIKLAKEVEFLQGDCERLSSQLERQQTGNVPVERLEELAAELRVRDQELADLDATHASLEREWRGLQSLHQRTSAELAQLRESSVSRVEFDALQLQIQQLENTIRAQQAAVDFAKDDRGNLLNEVARLKADKMALNQEMVMLHDELEDRTKVRDEAIQAYEELRAYLEQNGSAAKSAVQTTKPQRTVSQDRVSAPVRIAETIIVAKEEPPELPRLESPAESIAPAPVVMERSSVPKPVEENAEAPPSPPAPASPAVVLPTIQLQATSSSAPRRTVPTQPVSYQSFDGEKSPLKKKPGEGGTAEPDLFSVSSADPDALDGEQDGLSGKRPPGLSVPRGGKEDNLALIKGVGPQSVERLNQIGIWHFAQVAAWSAEETEWVGNYLSFPGRIERDQWVSQASQLAQGIIAAPAEPKRRAGSRRRR